MTLNSRLDSVKYSINPPHIPGEMVNVTISMTNTGTDRKTDSWYDTPMRYETPSFYYYHVLLAVNDNARSIAPNGWNPIYSDAKFSKLPYVVKTFDGYNKVDMIFKFSSPEIPGEYTYVFQMCRIIYSGLVHGGNPSFTTFGDLVSFTITVIPNPDSQVLANTYPDIIYVAERAIVFITVKNTGVWTWDYNFRLEAINTDATNFSKSLFYIPVDKQIPPGGSYSFQVPIRAPVNTGTYQPQYRMYWYRSGGFGEIAAKTVVVNKPVSIIKNLDDYRWIGLTARRSTADIAWQYDYEINGVDFPPVFGRLIHEEDGHCALMGEPVDYEINYDYPSVSTTMTAYSYGYFLRDRLPWNKRQSRAGNDIKSWQMADSNISAIQGRLDEITTYENPSHYIARILFYVDDNTGAIDTSRAGPFGLWCGDVKPVPNWGIESTDGRFDRRHPTTEDPFMIEKKQFAYDGEKITDILEDIAEHCHMIYFTRFVKVDGVWREYFYWIPKFGVALGWLGIDQTPIQITPDTAGLVGSPGLSGSVVMEQSYNCVWVEACRKKDSAWFYANRSGTGVVAGLEVPRTLYYRSHDLLPDPAGNTWNGTISTSTNFGPGGQSYGTAAEDAAAQAIVEAKADQLLSLLEYRIPTFTATMRKLSFELYQVVIFNGFPGLSDFNSIEMQIVDMQYDYMSSEDGGHTVTITCAPKAQLQASGKFQSVIDEIQQNFENLKEDIAGNNTDDKLSIILSTYSGGSMCNAQLRSSGSLIKTRTYGYRTAQG